MATRKRLRTDLGLDHILETLRRHMPELRQRYGILSLAVFGSYVKGQQQRRSDLDVLVEFEPGARMTLFRFVELEHELTTLVGIRIDLVMKSALRPAIGERILAEAVPV